MWIKDTVQMGFDLIEMVFDKIRWNVMGIAVIIAYLITDFGDKLINLLSNDKTVEPELIITVIVGLIGTGIGGLDHSDGQDV